MQKEKLSALMDGETFDSEVLDTLTRDVTLQRSWQSYHLIRDTLRGDTGKVIHYDIAARVAMAIGHEPAKLPGALIPDSPVNEDQTLPGSWVKIPFWHKVRPWAAAQLAEMKVSASLIQFGVAASISLVVIAGYQHFNRPVSMGNSNDSPVFNTLPMIGQSSPVSYGVTQETSAMERQAQEQRRRVNAMIQDYELQRRIYAEQLQVKQNVTQPSGGDLLPGIQQQ